MNEFKIKEIEVQFTRSTDLYITTFILASLIARREHKNERGQCRVRNYRATITRVLKADEFEVV